MHFSFELSAADTVAVHFFYSFSFRVSRRADFPLTYIRLDKRSC